MSTQVPRDEKSLQHLKTIYARPVSREMSDPNSARRLYKRCNTFMSILPKNTKIGKLYNPDYLEKMRAKEEKRRER